MSSLRRLVALSLLFSLKTRENKSEKPSLLFVRCNGSRRLESYKDKWNKYVACSAVQMTHTHKASPRHQPMEKSEHFYILPRFQRHLGDGDDSG